MPTIVKCGRCGRELQCASSLIGGDEKVAKKIIIVLFGQALIVADPYCQECLDYILKNGSVINPFILKEEVDKAIKNGLIVS